MDAGMTPRQGQFLAFSATGNPRPIIDIKFPFYAELEGIIVGQTAKGWLDAINLEDDLASRGAGV